LQMGMVASERVFKLLDTTSQIEDKGSISRHHLTGDISFINKFGKKPILETSETLRLKTHLEYVELLLRKKNVKGFSENRIKQRTHTLDLLHDYWVAGVFPKNYESKGKRLPCFIDKDRKICAVGYLIEKTAGRQLSEKINLTYKYEYVFNMNDKTIDDWRLANGLTKLECAMIQPTYIFQDPIIEFKETIGWDGNGKYKKYNQLKLLIEEGRFKNYKLMNGKKYVYGKNNILIRIEIYKKGKRIKKNPIKYAKELKD
ncbi:MAG: hypothetical protein HRT73_13720, partial [Flavobacteriales bacterium]|nr:hypothetical protein [Flavobacteriales bacterium]